MIMPDTKVDINFEHEKAIIMYLKAKRLNAVPYKITYHAKQARDMVFKLRKIHIDITLHYRLNLSQATKFANEQVKWLDSMSSDCQ